MKIVQINAIVGRQSTGVIVRDLHNLCCKSNMDSYVIAGYDRENILADDHTYQVNCAFGKKIHALVNRLSGKQAYWSFQTTKEILLLFDKIRPDIVHLHNLHNNYLYLNGLLTYLARKNIATVITMHDCWYFTGGCTHFTRANCMRWKHKCGQCPQMNSINTWVIDASEKVLSDREKYLSDINKLYMVGVSNWMTSQASQSVIKDAHYLTIHNGVDMEMFKYRSSKVREKLDIKNEDFVVLAPAIKWYNPNNRQLLIELTRGLEGKCKIVFFGCAKIDESLPSNIVQVGYIRNPFELAELYSASDVFVNCTHEDSLPFANMEPQACGTPVVTFDNTGATETVDGVCGFAVQTDSVDLMIEKILEIKSKGRAFYSESCVSWVEKEFNKERNYSKYIDLYKDITNGGEM